MLNRLDRPGAVAVVLLLVAGVFVVARLDMFGDDVSRFVMAGDHFTDPARVSPRIPVLRDSTGYDGQYYFRLALDPLTDKRTAHGVTLASPAYFQQRLLYPSLVWVAARGGPSTVPWALVGVNLAALAVLGFASGVLARAAGRHALWGLAFGGMPAVWIALGRDLTDVVSLMFVVSALVLLRRERAYPAALALTAAVLTRETTVIIAGTVGLAWLFRRRPPFVVAAAPVGTFFVVQALLWWRWVALPVRQGSGPLDGVAPFSALVNALRFQFRHDQVSGTAAIAVVLVVALTAALVFRTTRAGLHEKLAFVVYALLLVTLPMLIWAFDVNFFRASEELIVLSLLIVLDGPAPTTALAVVGSSVTAGSGLILTELARGL